jgi:predicted metal-binding membrane protein
MTLADATTVNTRRSPGKVAELYAATRRSILALPWRDRILVACCVIVLTALAWAGLVHFAQQMMPAMTPDTSMADMAMPEPWSASEFGLLFAMWTVMMVGMMTPAATPVLLLFAGAQIRRDPRHARIAVAMFALGYAIVWITFSACAALAQWMLHASMTLSPQMAVSSARAGAVVLCAAGAYQLLPIKRACLVRCRSPLGFLMTRWRDGARGALGMGLRHGAWCVGCCWALMGALFALGIMSVAWMAFVAGLIAVEKILPWRRVATWGTAGLLLGLGVLMLAAPSAIPGLTIPGGGMPGMGM